MSRPCGPVSNSIAISVQRPRQRVPGRRQAEAARGVAAGEHQRQPARAVGEVLQRLRIGLRRIGVVDPLHDLPWRRGPAAGDRRGVGRAPVDRVDLEAVGGLADQLLERGSLQDAVNQFAPVVIGRGRKRRRKRQIMRQIIGRRGHSAGCSLKDGFCFRLKLPCRMCCRNLLRVG